MKNFCKIFMLAVALCLLLGVSALAASAEPAADAAAEAVSMSFDVNVKVNGGEEKTATIGVECEGNVYRLQIAELLDVLGVSFSYDEESGIATIAAEDESSLAALFGAQIAVAGNSAEPVVEEASAEPVVEEASAEPAVEEASAEPVVEEASAEPVVEEASAEPAVEEASAEPVVEEASAEPAVEEASAEPVAEDAAAESAEEPAELSQPATAEEFQAYVDYCIEFMNAYDGVGDGSFDESARAMALGELGTVAFGDDVYAFPFEMYVNAFGALDYAAFASQGAAPEAGGDTGEAAYQDYLCAFVMSCEDILASGAEEEFMALIRTGDYVSYPVEMLFNAQWFGEAAMTYDEFVAAGGVYEIAEHPSNGERLDGTGE